MAYREAAAYSLNRPVRDAMGRPKKSAPPIEPGDESQDIAALEAQEPEEGEEPEDN